MRKGMGGNVPYYGCTVFCSKGRKDGEVHYDLVMSVKSEPIRDKTKCYLLIEDENFALLETVSSGQKILLTRKEYKKAVCAIESETGGKAS